jgi:undecaprenyl-diphosphatase
VTAPGLTRRALIVCVVSVVSLAVLAALVVAPWRPLLEFDHALGAWLHGIAVDHPALVRAADVIAVAFSPSVFRVLVLALAGWLLWQHRSWLAFWAVLTMTAGGAVGLIGKVLAARARPSFPDPVGHAPGYSFPSGHAINAALGVLVILVVILPLIRRGAVRIAIVSTGIVVVLVTGLDRMVLGVHYLTDVVAAWLAAVAVVAGTAHALRGRLEPPPEPDRQPTSAGVAS